MIGGLGNVGGKIVEHAMANNIDLLSIFRCDDLPAFRYGGYDSNVGELHCESIRVGEVNFTAGFTC